MGLAGYNPDHWHQGLLITGPTNISCAYILIEIILRMCRIHLPIVDMSTICMRPRIVNQTTIEIVIVIKNQQFNFNDLILFVKENRGWLMIVQNDFLSFIVPSELLPSLQTMPPVSVSVKSSSPVNNLCPILPGHSSCLVLDMQPSHSPSHSSFSILRLCTKY